LASPLDALILDLLEWIGSGTKPYAEVMDAWRTSCPRLTVWEDANERGFVERRYDQTRGACVSVTAAGRDFLARSRRTVTTLTETSRND
jgi:D-3-phosphoglycerate dehydrogenase / 2-oxoglutarate reductase